MTRIYNFKDRTTVSLHTMKILSTFGNKSSWQRKVLDINIAAEKNLIKNWPGIRLAKESVGD